MDEMPSTEFRKRYTKLTTPTTVTVNGHVIGEWRPAGHDPLAGLDNEQITALAKSRWRNEAERDEIVRTRVPNLAATTQKRRDALLGKINRR